MTIDIGPPAGEAELERFAVIAHEALAFPLPSKQDWLDHYDRRWFRLARVGGRVAAGLVALPVGQWFGGRPVPMAGIHAVAVAAEHRGSQVGSMLMRETMSELHRQGVALSTLYPATQPIYRRVGFEQAGTWTRYRMSPAAIDVRDRGLAIERVEAGSAEALVDVYARQAAVEAGNLDRDDWCWRRILPSAGAPKEIYRAVGDDGPEGYIVLAHQRGPGADPHPWHLRCSELVALTPGAARRLLTLLADHRSTVDQVMINASPAPALGLHLREQVYTVDRTIRWMLRLVHVRAALEARGYPAGLELTLDLDVCDELLAGNAGPLRLRIGGGEGAVEAGGTGALRADVRGLAALYSGYASPAHLVAAGLMSGPPEALAAAAAAFSGPPPWMPDLF